MSNSYKEYASKDWVNEKHSWDELKNKPFGETTTVKELLAEQTFTFDADESWTALEIPLLVIGKKYTVDFNGTKYDCVCYSDNGMTTVGAPYGDWSKYPFVVYNGVDEVVYCVVQKAGTYTISISGEVDTIVKMSGKYVEGMGWSEPTPPLFDAKGVPFDVNLGTGGYGVMLPTNKQLIVGKSYTVILDGVTYEHLVAIDGEPGARIGGNPSGALSEDVPFSIFNYSGVVQVNVRTGTTHDIAIMLEEETIHTIDPKYLPEGTGLVLTDTITGTKYQLFVTDGKLILVQYGEAVPSEYPDAEEVGF